MSDATDCVNFICRLISTIQGENRTIMGKPQIPISHIRAEVKKKCKSKNRETFLAALKLLQSKRNYVYVKIDFSC